MCTFGPFHANIVVGLPKYTHPHCPQINYHIRPRVCGMLLWQITRLTWPPFSPSLLMATCINLKRRCSALKKGGATLSNRLNRYDMAGLGRVNEAPKQVLETKCKSANYTFISLTDYSQPLISSHLSYHINLG